MPIRQFSEPLPTLGRSLERQRVAYRARRVELVLSALRERERAVRDRDEEVPAGLLQSIREFEADLARLTRRLEAVVAPDDRRRPAGSRSAAAL